MSVSARLFHTIFEAEYDYVWASLRRLGVPPRELEDLAHEVFLRIHHNLEKFDETRPLRPWLFAFAFRVASEHRRLRRNMWEQPRADLDDAGPTALHGAEARGEARDLVHRALGVLSETTRPVFIMYEMDGFTMKEVAAALDLPLNTAYSRLRLAREAFVACVTDLQGSKEGTP